MKGKYKIIRRRELPAYERAGCVAQLVMGSEILTITLHETSVDWETERGVTVPVSKGLSDIETGYSNTVLIGSVCREGKPYLLDTLMLQKKSQRQKAWRARVAIASNIVSRVGRHFDPVLRIAPEVSSGLLVAFDTVCSKGGLGMIVRVSGKPVNILCKKED